MMTLYINIYVIVCVCFLLCFFLLLYFYIMLTVYTKINYPINTIISIKLLCSIELCTITNLVNVFNGFDPAITMMKFDRKLKFQTYETKLKTENGCKWIVAKNRHTRTGTGTLTYKQTYNIHSPELITMLYYVMRCNYNVFAISTLFLLCCPSSLLHKTRNSYYHILSCWTDSLICLNI